MNLIYLEHCRLQLACLLVILYLTFIYYKERRRYHLTDKVRLYDVLLISGRTASGYMFSNNCGGERKRF